MLIYRIHEIPRNPGDFVFRHSPFVPALMTMTLLVASIAQAAVVWVIIAHGFTPLMLGLLFFGITLPITLLGLLACWSSLRACFRDSNWLVWSGSSGLWIKFRSYTNHHFPEEDPVVVFIGQIELSSVRKTLIRREIPSVSQGLVVEWLTYLDVRLKHPTSELLLEAIALERQRKAPKKGFSRTKSLHYPVSVPEPDLVRVEWVGIRPGIRRAMELLSQTAPVAEEQQLNGGRLEGLNSKEMEDLILNLCKSGNVVQAVKLIRRRYGWDLTHAKQFVQELVSDRKPPNRY